MYCTAVHRMINFTLFHVRSIIDTFGLPPLSIGLPPLRGCYDQDRARGGGNGWAKKSTSAAATVSIVSKVPETMISRPLISCVDIWLVPTIDKDPNNWINHEALIGEDRDELLQRLWKIYDLLPSEWKQENRVPKYVARY